MKLIDILVRDLPGLGGWPVGVSKIEQSSEGRLFDYRDLGKPCLFGEAVFDLADDWNDDLSVTRKQYESALAARKTEWNGEGLPPVGSRVEVRAEDFEGGWVAIDVVYVHNGEVAGIVQSENEYLNDKLEKFSAGYNRAEFRPIRSEADKKRDEAIESITSLIEYRNGCHAKALAGWLFEEIAFGKIQHIRID